MISDIWKLAVAGGAAQPAHAYGITAATLTTANLADDVLELREPLPAGVTPATPFVAGATVELTRDGVVWFRGVVRRRPVVLNRVRTVRVLGAWSTLARRPFLQDFAAPSDPADPDSELVAVKRGRVVLGQGDDGLKLTATAFLAQVLTYAGVALGEVDIGETLLPYEDATDLSCADVIARWLRWLPDVALWFDYSTAPITAHARRRADLPVTTIDVESQHVVAVSLEPRDDLVVDRVALFYVATNRANSAAWETVTPDVYPPGSTGTEEGALVRTIQLGGAVSDRAYLTQKVDTRDIPAGLTDAALAATVTATSNPTLFATLSNFWRRVRPELNASGVTILGFRNGKRVRAEDGGAPTAGLRELVSGGLTEWMQADDADLLVEDQVVSIDVAYRVVSPQDPAKVGTRIESKTTTLRATNLDSRTYSQLASASGVAAEPIPEGLAEALYGALHPLQFEGSIVLVEQEATARPGVGARVHLANDREEYATMGAMVRARVVEIHGGRTSIEVGPPVPVSAAGLVEIYRTNRTRRPSDGYLVRVTGRSGGGVGVASPLPTKQPIEATTGATVAVPSVYEAALTVAGTVPTAAEIKAAVESAYTGGKTPMDGDVVNLTFGGAVRLRSHVTTQGTASGIWVVAFTVGGLGYFAQQVQAGTW